ncbi:MAG: ADP-ribosylglycohydrolase family protein [Bryobacteraceae bacterium]|nr:ADP-ribosylglycohydrolase family protein [Bryobacteraceae bacterium]
MLGAIAGDVIGSVYEGNPIKTKDFPLFGPRSTFTDDSVLSAAVASWILDGGDLVSIVRRYAQVYPNRGYGASFQEWLETRSHQPYGSFGNGSAMRVSPVGWAFGTIEETLDRAAGSAAITHNHPEGIRGAQATAAAVFFARQTRDKELIKAEVERRFGYDLSHPLDEIRPGYSFDVTCQGTVPQALRAFLESKDYEDAVRNAISLGGDADTLAAIAGSVAEAYYGSVPPAIETQVIQRLDEGLIATIRRFQGKFLSR